MREDVTQPQHLRPTPAYDYATIFTASLDLAWIHVQRTILHPRNVSQGMYISGRTNVR
jgi:hypothetical protein